MGTRFKLSLLSTLLVAGAIACAPGTQTTAQKSAETRAEEQRQPERVERYEKFEVELPAGEARVTARFIEPDGDVVRVGGFEAGQRRLVRFTPVEVGRYAYRIDETGGGSLTSGEFIVFDGDEPGFARLDPRGGFPGVQLDDGTPLVILGENRINIYDPSWNYRKKGISDYIAYMADHGMTTLRVFIFSDCEHEESRDKVQPGCLEPELGEFDEEVARSFDEIFEAAEREGIYVVLTPFAIGFSPDDTWKSWHDNPYSAHRGGPAKTRFAFFDDPAVREQAFERLRYVIDRWGYSPNLLAIDLLNEPEWDGEIGEDAWIPWAREMVDALAEIDPYDHLITVGSVGLHWNVDGDEHRWYADPRNDLVQWHLYGPKVYKVHDLARVLAEKIEETRHHDKPTFVGEFAYGGEGKPYDHTHVGLWSATMAGVGALAHSAPPFNIDSDSLMVPQRARHFEVLRAYIEPLLDRAPLAPDPVVELGDEARMWTLRGDDAVGVWLMGPETGYGEPVDGMRVDLALPAGQWRLEWIDDVTGEVVETETLASSGEVRLEAPTFERHVAARLWRVGEA